GAEPFGALAVRRIRAAARDAVVLLEQLLAAALAARPELLAHPVTSLTGRARRARGGSGPAGHDGRTPPARGGGSRSACPHGCETIICVTAPTKESPFLRACRRQPVPHTPVWFMRQAGRSLPEYRAARKKRKSMLAACMTPDLVTELTLQPLRRYHVDAAILFSDIVVPLRAVGVDVDIKPGIGPVIPQPVRREPDLARLRALEPPAVSYLV